MATATVLLNTRYKSKNDTYPIVIRISDGKKQMLYNTGYKVLKEQFKNGEVKKHVDALIINSRIDEKLRSARRYIDDCRERNRKVDFNLIFKTKQSYSFIDYLRHRATQYEQKGQIEMRFKVNRFALELQECFTELYFDEINQDTLRTFDAFLIKNNCNNTRAKKFSFLRMFYDNAVLDGKANSPNPFKSYKINLEPVRKEKLSVSDIKKLEEIELADGAISCARDIFLFSYYCKGQRFETCITLQKQQIYNKRIHFQSNKGKKFLSVLIHSKLEQILEKYIQDHKDCHLTEILFPFLKDIPENKTKYRSVIGSQNVIVNRNLKKLAVLCGIKPFSFHIARHSFAYHMKGLTDNIHVIKDSLGHSRSSTTEIYLQSLDDERLDSEMRKLYGD